MANPFDQFDTTANKAQDKGRSFDQFDPVSSSTTEDDGIEADAVALADQLEKLDPGGESGIGELFGNSFVLGLKDKVAGLAGGVGGMIKGDGFSRGYQVSRRAQEILEERARERTGVAGKAAELVGSVATGVLAKAPAAATTAGRILQGGREAGTLATIQGVGDSEADSVGGMATDAAASGLMGAGLGAGFTGLVEAGRAAIAGTRAAWRGARNALDDPAERAGRQVYDKLIADGLTPDQAAARMAKRDTALVNVGDENTLGLARAASAKPGEGRTIINKALDGQQKVSRQKVIEAVSDAFPDGGKSFNNRVADIVTTRANLGKTQYEAAFTKNFGSEHAMVFDDIAERLPAEAVRNAQKIAVAEGRPFGEQLIASIDDAGGVAFKRAPSLREWHYIQRGLRSAKDAAYRNGVGEVGTAYGALHKDLLKAMDDAQPLYAKARKAYSSASDMLDALQRGREILQPTTTKNVDALVTELGDLSKAEREMVKLGLARQMQDLVESTPDQAGNMVKKLFGTQAKRSAIRAVFDSDSAFRKFENELGNIAKEAKAFNYVRQGSRTSFVDAEKADAGALAEAAGAAADAASGGVGSTLVRGALRILKNVGGMDENVAREVAKLLVEKDPAVVKAALAAPAGKAAGQQAVTSLLAKARPFVRAATVGISSTVGSESGRAVVGGR